MGKSGRLFKLKIMAYDSQILRFKVTDATRFDPVIDYITGLTPIAYVNNTLDIQVTAYQLGVVADISAFSSAVIEVKSLENGTPPPHDDPAVISKTISSFDNTTTDATFKNRTKQHMVFSFTDSEMDIPPANYWISCYAVTSGGKTIVLFAGVFKIKNPGTQSGL